MTAIAPHAETRTQYLSFELCGEEYAVQQLAFFSWLTVEAHGLTARLEMAHGAAQRFRVVPLRITTRLANEQPSPMITSGSMIEKGPTETP